MASISKSLNIVGFLGSTRNAAAPWGGAERLGSRVAKFIEERTKARGHSIEIIDPIDVKLPLLEKPHFYYAKGTAPPELESIAQKIRNADAFLVISGEYNHSIPPALTNLMDHFGGSNYAWKPSGIVCYSIGQFGGMRAAMQLRSFLGELGCLSVSNICSFPKAQEEFNEDGSPALDPNSPDKRFHSLMSQLEWWAQAAKGQRESVGLPK